MKWASQFISIQNDFFFKRFSYYLWINQFADFVHLREEDAIRWGVRNEKHSWNIIICSIKTIDRNVASSIIEFIWNSVVDLSILFFKNNPTRNMNVSTKLNGIIIFSSIFHAFYFIRNLKLDILNFLQKKFFHFQLNRDDFRITFTDLNMDCMYFAFEQWDFGDLLKMAQSKRIVECCWNEDGIWHDSTSE